MSPTKLLRPKNIQRDNKEILLKECVSSFEDLTKGGFKEILDDPLISNKRSAQKVKSVICCSGKIYYDLLDEKINNKLDDVAIIRFEQLYPFPFKQLNNLKDKYSPTKWLWVQEEPSNMGGWQFIHSLQTGIDFELVGRKASASPATGFKNTHLAQQNDILERAFAYSTKTKETVAK